MNRAALLEPEESGMEIVKRAGLAFRDKVEPGDKIAGRKPYFAFYAGGKYTPIPLAPYDDVMGHLMRENVQLLELHQPTIQQFRPPLRPLLYAAAVIKGELRFRQMYFDPSGVTVYERRRDDDPLRWTRVTLPENMDVMPAWSPDGTLIAFRSGTSGGTGGIYVIESTGGGLRKITNSKMREDEISWSPDGKRIAFANGERPRLNLYTVDVETGKVSEMVTGGGNNYSPSWSPTGGEIVFCSDRTGPSEIWSVSLASGELNQISSDGGNTRPAVSPSAQSIAWIRDGQGVVIMDPVKERLLRIRTPRRVHYAPAWSPDERYIAVTAEDWGSMDVYLLKTDGSNVLLLTKNHKRDVMPAWSPDRRRIALASDLDSTTASIWVIEGVEPYLGRLDSEYEYRVFSKPLTP
jgi:TolB protein